MTTLAYFERVQDWENWDDTDFEEFSEKFLQMKQSVDYTEYKKIKTACLETEKFIEDHDYEIGCKGQADLEREAIEKKYYNRKMSQSILYCDCTDSDLLLLKVIDKKENSIILSLESNEPNEILSFILLNSNLINSIDSNSFKLIADYLYI